MRFKDRQQNTKIPTIDLIPMLTVMMGVLGFFITISTLQMAPPERVEVSVPDDQETQQVSGPESSKPLLIRLQGEDQADVEGQVLTQEQVLARIAEFIGQNDKAPVVLVAEPQVPYDFVIRWLTTLRTAGGDRVSLGINPKGGGGGTPAAGGAPAAGTPTSAAETNTATPPAAEPAAAPAASSPAAGGFNFGDPDDEGGVEIIDTGVRDSDED